MIGEKVKLTPHAAKWMLEHLDFWYSPSGKPDPEFDAEVQSSLLVLLGGEVQGTVTRYGAERAFGVEFKTPFGNYYTYYEYPRDIQRL